MSCCGNKPYDYVHSHVQFVVCVCVSVPHASQRDVLTVTNGT